jgi:predicted phosphodiesterase
MSEGPFAILADIHANSAALRTVLEHLDERGIRRILFLGDLVGYNADPIGVFRLLKDREVTYIGGNHDRYVAHGIGEELLRPPTVQAVEYSRSVLTDREISFLQGLEDQKTVGEFLTVHGSPRDRDEYILTKEAAVENLHIVEDDHRAVRICFFGHCHLPMVIGDGLIETVFRETRTVALDRDKTYLVNPGGVGQPRDRCPLTSFALFDPDRWELTITRLPYPIEETQRQIREAGLDESLAARLGRGS